MFFNFLKNNKNGTVSPNKVQPYLVEQDSVLLIVLNETDTIQRRDFWPITVSCKVQNAFTTALFRANAQTKH